jgi:DNA-binding transcriptional regulator GbsR (MarR family)
MNQTKSLYAFCKLIKKAEKKEIDLNEVISLWEKWRETNKMDGYLDDKVKEEEQNLIKELLSWSDFIYELDTKVVKQWSRSKRFKYHLYNIVFSYQGILDKLKSFIKNKKRKKKLIDLKQAK